MKHVRPRQGANGLQADHGADHDEADTAQTMHSRMPDMQAWQQSEQDARIDVSDRLIG